MYWICGQHAGPLKQPGTRLFGWGKCCCTYAIGNAMRCDMKGQDLGLQVVDLPDAEGPKVFSYDEEWLAILRTTHSLLSLKRKPAPLPGQTFMTRRIRGLLLLRTFGPFTHAPSRGFLPEICGDVCLTGMGALRRGPNLEDVQYVREAVAARGGPEVPQNFAPTAPGHDGRARRGVMPSRPVRNPQVKPYIHPKP